MKTFLTSLLTAFLAAAPASAVNFDVLHLLGQPVGNVGINPTYPPLAGPDGTLYGVAFGAGSGGSYGVVYNYLTNGYSLVLKNFTNGPEGVFPTGQLLLIGNTLYGTTAGFGPPNSWGTVFKVNTDGSGFANLYAFTNGVDGYGPYSGVILVGSALYGVASGGGSGGEGTVFAINTNGTGFAVLKAFSPRDFFSGTNCDGAAPRGGLVANGNVVYGTTQLGGPDNSGVAFSINVTDSAFQVIHNFVLAQDGIEPNAPMTIVGGMLFGTLPYGTGVTAGTLFAMNLDGSGYTNLYAFTGGADGASPNGSMVFSEGVLYGTCEGGGDNGNGNVFSYNISENSLQEIHAFSPLDSDYDYYNNDGANPEGGLCLSGNILYGTAEAGGYAGLGTLFEIPLNNLGFYPIYDFDSVTSVVDGSEPEGAMTLAGNALYGTTVGGGTNAIGVVFKMNVDGSGFQEIHSFRGGDGSGPMGGLVLNGCMLYGATISGGSVYDGNIYAVSLDGLHFTNLYSFTNGIDGKNPEAGLALGGNTLYGTASAGGSNFYGTVFSVNTDGTGFKVLHSFDFADGKQPEGSLVLNNGVLYGEAYNGGNGNGTIFKLAIDGSGFQLLRNFSLSGGTGPTAEGANPSGGLLLAGSALYGTTASGGDQHYGNVFKINTDGSGYATLGNFSPDVATTPDAGLVLLGSTLYGAAYGGGVDSAGIIFEISTNANGISGLTNLYTFNGRYDGGYPYATLTYGGGGTFYGTGSGGYYYNGSIFSIGLVPQLLINVNNNAPLVFWQDDGAIHTLQKTTNLASGIWTTAPALNWTNYPYIGLQLTNPPTPPTEFFRLQQ